MTSRLAGVISLLLLLLFHGVAFGVVRRRMAAHGDAVELSGKDAPDIVSDILYVGWLGLDVLAGLLVVTGVIRINHDQLPPLSLVAGGTTLVLLLTFMAAWSEQKLGQARHIHPAGSPAGLLVTDGPFRLVRHPISVAVAALSICVAALAPTGLGAIAAVLCIVGRQVHVRRESEPRLRARFGPQYQHYSESTGRFFPFVGRAKPVGEAALVETVTDSIRADAATPDPNVPAPAIQMDEDGNVLTAERMGSPMPPPNPAQRSDRSPAPTADIAPAAAIDLGSLDLPLTPEQLAAPMPPPNPADRTDSPESG